jgi:hypothetical protein
MKKISGCSQKMRNQLVDKPCSTAPLNVTQIQDKPLCASTSLPGPVPEESLQSLTREIASLSQSLVTQSTQASSAMEALRSAKYTVPCQRQLESL